MRLEVENAKLRQENRELRAENSTLKARVTELEAAVAAMQWLPCREKGADHPRLSKRISQKRKQKSGARNAPQSKIRVEKLDKRPPLVYH
jgi:uncharacterized protein YlxW (UPF0749 family)